MNFHTGDHVTSTQYRQRRTQKVKKAKSSTECVLRNDGNAYMLYIKRLQRHQPNVCTERMEVTGCLDINSSDHGIRDSHVVSCPNICLVPLKSSEIEAAGLAECSNIY